MFMGCKESARVVSMHQVASFYCHNAVYSHAWRYALFEQLTHGYDTQTSYIAKLSACMFWQLLLRFLVYFCLFEQFWISIWDAAILYITCKIRSENDTANLRSDRPCVHSDSKHR